MKKVALETVATLLRPWQRPTTAIVKLRDDGRVLKVTTLKCIHEIELTQRQRLNWMAALSRGLEGEGLE